MHIHIHIYIYIYIYIYIHVYGDLIEISPAIISSKTLNFRNAIEFYPSGKVLI